jgi:hypothetical protein
MKYNKYLKSKSKSRKIKNELCNDSMSFQECEKAILRNAIDKTEQLVGFEMANNSEVKKIIGILEEFLRKKKLVCYGGTAINNILPKEDQFYNTDIEIPDYDFYSNNALEDAKQLADIYFKNGYIEIEAKAGVHLGTYKVFVNFLPIADITQMHKSIFKTLQKDSIKIKGIHYAPPNFLRMNMYLELSRPRGDVSRWEKVYERLSLLNKHYPLLVNNEKCGRIDFERIKSDKDDYDERLYLDVRDILIDIGAVFFGGYAVSLYSKYDANPDKQPHQLADFDVLMDNIDKAAEDVKTQLKYKSEYSKEYKHIKIIKHEGVHEIIPESIEIIVNNKSVVNIYSTLACHNYNTITIHKQKIKIATLYTIMNLYFAFIYTNEKRHNKDKLLCMAKYLFDIEKKHKLENDGILNKFNVDCVGEQLTLADIRAEKAEKYNELTRDTLDYEKWFLKYMPGKNKTTHSKNYTRKNSKHIKPKTASASIEPIKKDWGFLY